MRISKDNPLDKARELGNAISQSKEYLSLKKAEEDFHSDKVAIELLEKFNNKNENYNSLIYRGIETYDTSLLMDEISLLQDEIERNIVIQNLFNAQKDYNNLVKNVNNIIDYIIGNEKKNCLSNKCGSCNCSNR